MSERISYHKKPRQYCGFCGRDSSTCNCRAWNAALGKFMLFSFFAFMALDIIVEVLS